MTNKRQHIAGLLPVMAQAFSKTFFADPRQVRPLKVNIHQDLVAALPAGINPAQANRFLAWYVHRPTYLKALAEGKGRVDLTGAVVEAEIPEPIRQQARERWQPLQIARQNARSANPTGTRPSAQPAPRAVTARVPPIHLEELYAMAVDAKLEVTLKFTTLPNAKPAGQGKMVFALKTLDGQYVTVEVSNKVWSKLVKAAEDWPAWTAALSGTMGVHTEKGFTLENAGLQVFERKPKAPAEAPPPPAAEDAPPAAPVTPPAEAAPTLAAPRSATAGTTAKRPALSLKPRKATP